MSSHFKYTLYKHKTKLWIGASVLLCLFIGIAGYFLFLNGEKGKHLNPGEIESQLADFIVSATKEGEISLVEIETGENIDHMTLPKGNYLYTVNRDYDKVYAYDGKVVTAVEIDGGKLKKLGELAQISVDEPNAFAVEGDHVVILSNHHQTITYVYPSESGVQTKEITLQDNVTAYHLLDGVLLYASQNDLYMFSPTQEKTIHLGDVTDVITSFQGKVLAHNQFGSGLGNNILLTLQKDDLLILELEKTNASEVNLLSLDSDDHVFYTTTYVSSVEPYHLLDKWTIEDGRIIKEKDITVKIPVKKDGILYNYDTTVASDGYLYTHYKDRIQIFDIRSQAVYKNIPVSEDFATPILAE